MCVCVVNWDECVELFVIFCVQCVQCVLCCLDVLCALNGLCYERCFSFCVGDVCCVSQKTILIFGLFHLAPLFCACVFVCGSNKRLCTLNATQDALCQFCLSLEVY